MLPELHVDLHFRSGDGRFGLVVPSVQLTQILRSCQEAGGRETGGIVLGRYTTAQDCAIVTAVSGAPSDSRGGRAWFLRGIRGLQRVIERAWHRHGVYYLGEWHFHPYAAAKASPTDHAQMVAFAEDDALHCPEPVLLIIGGDPRGSWDAGAWVFPRGREGVELVLDVDLRSASAHSHTPSSAR